MFSVVIPTYNRAHLIQRAVQSVLRQTYSSWELIIVDDASTDETTEVLKKYEEDDQIKLIFRTGNGGNAAARNDGVRAARGEVISFLDSDDEFTPGYLREMNTLIGQSDIETGMFWCASRMEGSNARLRKVWKPDETYRGNPDHFLYELHTGTRGLSVRAKCFEKVQFDERIRTSVDLDFLIRLRKRWQYAFTEKVLLVVHPQEESVRSDYASKYEAYQLIIDKHRQTIEGDCVLIRKWYYKMMWLSFYVGDPRLAEQCFERIRSKCTPALKERVVFLLGRLLNPYLFRKLHLLLHRWYSSVF